MGGAPGLVLWPVLRTCRLEVQTSRVEVQVREREREKERQRETEERAGGRGGWMMKNEKKKRE